MIKQILIISILFLGLICRAQETKFSGTVLDKKSGKGVPFATVLWFKDGKMDGLYCDSTGNFAFSQRTTPDSICINVIGYEYYKLVNPDRKIVARLTPKTYLLNEVTVLPPKEKKLEVKPIGFVDRGHGDPFTVAASYVKNNNYKNAYIKEITYKLDREKTYCANCMDMARVHLYKFNPKDSLPGDELLPEDMIVYITSETPLPLKVNVAKYNIKLPPEGIVVGYEYLGTFNKEKKMVDYTIHNNIYALSISTNNNSLISYLCNVKHNPKWINYGDKRGKKYFLFGLTILYKP